MKKQHLEYSLIAIVFVLIVVILQPDYTITGITLFMLANPQMNNLVFEEGLDYSDYDGAVILNCLHGGECPVGVSRTNDETGEIEEVGTAPTKSVPVAPTPEPTEEELFWMNYEPDTTTELGKTVDFAIDLYIILIIILAVSAVVIFIVLKKKLIKIHK